VKVIDASSLAKYVLKEKRWKNIEKHLLLAHSLELVQLETTNAIWKNYYLKRLAKEDTLKKFQALKILCKDVLILEESLQYLAEAFKISIQKKVTIYDILYIMQAINEKAELVTSDEKQAKIAKELKVKVLLI